jgi:membrane-associated phospholipid phosphatase
MRTVAPGIRLLIALDLLAVAVFAALTVTVSSNTSLAIDRRAFELANDVRAPWLDHAARIVTTLGLIAVVGPVVLLGAALLFRAGRRIRAPWLVLGAALAWASVWIVKALVDRPRPPAPLVRTSGQSYPSAHAANSIGWLAIAIALTALIRSRPGRVAAVTCGAVIAIVVGLSRIYLRAHYASDVLGGEALALASYATAAIVVTIAFTTNR